MDQKVNLRKVAVIGCGFVGSSSAFCLMQSGLFSEMVLLDVNKDRAEGEALDIAHGVPLTRPMKIYAGDYDDIVDAAIIVITAGANQKPGETRLDLVKKNVEIFKTIIPEISNRHCMGILLVVSNPVDILTYAALKISGFPKSRVIGSGTVLDTSRLKHLLGEHLGVDSRSVHAFIIGEHGDSEIAAFSSANVSGIPVHEFCELRGFYHHDKATKEFIPKGVQDPQQMLSDIWNTLNNRQKVNANILLEHHVYYTDYDGMAFVVIEVPRADRRDKPVYVGQDMFKGTFRRNHEGDYRCSAEEVKSMLRDQADTTQDALVLENLLIEDLNQESIHRYRILFNNLKPDHIGQSWAMRNSS